MMRGVSGRRRQWEGVFFILPSLAGVTAFILVPFADVVRRSFTEVMSGKFTGLKNYRTIFSNSAFLQAAGNTLYRGVHSASAAYLTGCGGAS